MVRTPPVAAVRLAIAPARAAVEPDGRIVASMIGSPQPIAHAVGAAGSPLSGAPARPVTAVADRLHIEFRAPDYDTLSVHIRPIALKNSRARGGPTMVYWPH